MRAELLFGRTIGGRLGVSGRQWLQFLKDEITPRFADGLTVIDGRGQWRNPANGAIVREQSKVVIIVTADTPAARERIALGQAWARQHGLEMPGFVAPAWLMSPAARQAVADAGFQYTCTLNRLIALPGGEELHAPSLVFSTRSAWRRGLSLLWNRSLAWRLRNAPLLRLELHPQDAEHPAVQRCWSSILARALRERHPLRLEDAAARLRASPDGGIGRRASRR